VKKIKSKGKIPYPEKAGLMELCISASLQGWGGLGGVAELRKRNKMQTKQ